MLSKPNSPRGWSIVEGLEFELRRAESVKLNAAKRHVNLHL
jgi:hypothetical protein